jgi:hypothetical protein
VGFLFAVRFGSHGGENQFRWWHRRVAGSFVGSLLLVVLFWAIVRGIYRLDTKKKPVA